MYLSYVMSLASNCVVTQTTGLRMRWRRLDEGNIYASAKKQATCI